MKPKPTKVQAPLIETNLFINVTPGKLYDITGFWSGSYHAELGHAFTIKGDNGKLLMCLEKKCQHINEMAWIVTETE